MFTVQNEVGIFNVVSFRDL